MADETFYGNEHQLIIDGSPTRTTGVLRIATSASRHSLATGQEGVRFNFTSAATSGTTRGLDVRLTQTGAAGEGDAFRAFMTVNANTTTCRGSHISLDFLATAGGSECTGLGTCQSLTLHLPDIAAWAPTGTLVGQVIEIFSDGAASDPAGLTELSLLRLANSGNATGKADVDTDAAAFSFQGWTAASGVTKFLSSTSLLELPASTVGIRCLVGSTKYRLPLVLDTEWN